MTEKRDFTSGRTFCALPWIHSYFATDGAAAVCCVASENIVDASGAALHVQDHSLADIFHSPAMNDIRRRMLAGEEVRACSACYDSERVTGSSHRVHYNKHWLDHVPDLAERIEAVQDRAAYARPLSVDFRYGNLCNLRCQICNAHNSSQIERDSVLMAWNNAHYHRRPSRFPGEWFEAPEFEAEVADFSSDVRLINLGGGEPSISKPVHRWFERLIASGQAAKAELRVSTNLTNVNPRFFDLAAQFETPRIFLSIDGFGPLNNYLRYPSKWQIVERNADYLVDLRARHPRMTIHLTPVVSAYNALSIVHLFEWAAARGFDIIANQVRGVPAIDCALIPEEPRRLIVARIRAFLAAVGKPIPNSSSIEALCQYLEAPVDPIFAADCREKFQAFTLDVDRDRGLRFEDYGPEMAGFLGYRSGSNSAAA